MCAHATCFENDRILQGGGGTILGQEIILSNSIRIIIAGNKTVQLGKYKHFTCPSKSNALLFPAEKLTII